MHPENPAPRHIQQVANILRNDGVIIYPTDTIYAIGCDMCSQKAIDKLCAIVGKKPEEANLSLICYDLSAISTYTVPFEDSIYKLMKRSLPGPYTFIMEANNKVPKMFKNKKRTIGIRVPDNLIAREIVRELGNPMVTASIHIDGNREKEYYTDPELIYEDYGKKADIVINGGMSDAEASTIIDVTSGEAEVVREGKGDLSVL